MLVPAISPRGRRDRGRRLKRFSSFSSFWAYPGHGQARSERAGGRRCCEYQLASGDRGL